jgi:MFS family permease
MSYGRNILILSIVFLVGSFATNLFGPIWSIYIKSNLKANMTEVGFVFSVSSAVAATMQILSGFLSDKYGRKRLHVLGTLLAAFPPLMYALATNWTDLIPWAMLSGFALGLYLPIRWAIVADDSSTEKMASAYGWTNISWLVGSTVAPFIGGVAADLLGIRFPFFACSILILAIFPLTLLMKETRRKPQVKAENRKDVNANMHQGYVFAVVLFSLINITQGIGIGVTSPVISVFASTNFSVDYTFIGILYAIGFGFASIVVQIPGSKCSDLFDRRKVMFVTFLASAPFFLLFTYSRNTLELILFMFLSNAILNLSWPAFQTLMMESTPSAKWGLVNGVSAMTFWIGLMLGNALSGILWDGWGTLAPFYASAFAIGMSAIMPLLLKETRKKKNSETIRK